MKLTKYTAALLCGIALAWPVSAQEESEPKEPPPAEKQTPPEEKAPEATPAAAKRSAEDPPLHRWGGWTVAAAAWEPTLLGADEEIAIRNQGGTPVPVLFGSDSSIEEIVDIVYHLPKEVGSVAAHYSAIGSDDSVDYFSPGQFGFFESRAFPGTRGVFEDATSDGVRGQAMRKTREFRLEFQRLAFDTKWARGTWGAGFRHVDHLRALGITYYALVPNLPPPPELPDLLRLLPLPDSVGQTSSYAGAGLGASFNVAFPLHRRFSIITGISIGIVRGKAENTFTSQTHYYAFNFAPDVPLTRDELFAVLSTPLPDDPTDPNNPPTARDISQFDANVRQTTLSESLMAQSYDVFVGFEVRAYQGLRIFATLRDLYYANVGEYIVPGNGFVNSSKTLNAGYEGYTLGLSWRF